MVSPLTVTAIKPRQRSKNRVNLFVNDRFVCALGRNTVKDSGVHVGQEISETEIENLKRADLMQRARDRALKFLGHGPKTEFEVRSRLKRYGYDAQVVATTIDRLRRAGHLDDESFAKLWKESRANSSTRSASLLARELRRKGIDDEIVAATVGDVDDEAEAYRAAYPKAVALRNADPQDFRRRLGTFLRSRGFDHEIIESIITRLWEAKDNEE